ncbi:lasso RiPP family leader peptide-containing protein [Streptomyces olivoreticuli]
MTDLMESTEAPAAEVYEPPALVEVGDFGRLTLGWTEGNVLEEGGEGQLWYRR